MNLKQRLAGLEAKKAEKVKARLAIHEAAGDNPMSPEQKAQWDALSTEIATFDTAISDVKAEIEHERTQPPSRSTAAPEPPRVRELRPRAENDRSGARGFASPRDFLLAAMGGSRARHVEDVSDERLRPLALTGDTGAPADSGDGMTYLLPEAFTPRGLKAAVGSDEQGTYSDPYGGYAVPKTLLPGMLQVGTDADPTIGRTQPIPMATPTVELLARTDKTHTSSVSGGFTVSRRAETTAPTSSRGEIEKVTLKAGTLMGLAYATEELLTDSPISFIAIIQAGFASQFAFHMLHEKLFGLGGNEYIGAAAAGNLSRITVTRDTSTRILGTDVIAMRARCWGYGSAIWIANQDCFGELMRLGAAAYDAQAATPLTGSNALFVQSMREDLPDMLLGRPVFFSESAETLGTTGDLLLANWSQYLEGLYQPLQSAESVHVRFSNHERTFKFWLRNAGAPWWRAALTPRESSTTLSPFIALT